MMDYVFCFGMGVVLGFILSCVIAIMIDRHEARKEEE